MDNPTVDTPREGVPDWAGPSAGTAAQVAQTALSGEPKITPRQREFLLALLAKKQIKPEHEGEIDLIMKCLRISEDPEEYGMSKTKASELITWFLTRPDKPRDVKTMNDYHLRTLPAGRYAIENNDGELRFYKKWVSKDDKRHSLYVQHGPDESSLPRPAQEAIATKIMLVGVRKCAIRYGMEIGECSHCGRRLTNRISRELGIGPICGGRMFGDEFKVEVKQKRDEIISCGDNPDEDVN